jgi:hypothetical protein
MAVANELLPIPEFGLKPEVDAKLPTSVSGIIANSKQWSTELVLTLPPKRYDQPKHHDTRFHLQ